jgi:hypothetical protein
MILRDEASADNLRNIAGHLSQDGALGMAPRVRLMDGGSAHIPMMDFLCSVTSKNLQLLCHLLGDFRQGGGYVLELGRSYHYYGLRLLAEDECQHFMGKSLLMSGLADDRYIGHQLIDGHCVLRLSPGNSTSHIPTVVAELI